MLAGCQSKPGVAAYVGDTQITVDQVNRIVDEIDAYARQNHASISEAGYGTARQQVLVALIIRDMAKQYVEDNSLSAPAVDLDGTAAQLQLPTSLEYTGVEAEAVAYFKLVTSKVGPVQPTDADLRDIYSRVPHGPQSYESLKDSIANLDGLPAALGVRNSVEKMIADYHVVVNPQYRGTRISLLPEPNGDGTSFDAVAVTFDQKNADGDFVTA